MSGYEVGLNSAVALVKQIAAFEKSAYQLLQYVWIIALIGNKISRIFIQEFTGSVHIKRLMVMKFTMSLFIPNYIYCLRSVFSVPNCRVIAGR